MPWDEVGRILILGRTCFDRIVLWLFKKLCIDRYQVLAPELQRFLAFLKECNNFPGLLSEVSFWNLLFCILEIVYVVAQKCGELLHFFLKLLTTSYEAEHIKRGRYIYSNLRLIATINDVSQQCTCLDVNLGLAGSIKAPHACLPLLITIWRPLLHCISGYGIVCGAWAVSSSPAHCYTASKPCWVMVILESTENLWSERRRDWCVYHE